MPCNYSILSVTKSFKRSIMIQNILYNLIIIYYTCLGTQRCPGYSHSYSHRLPARVVNYDLRYFYI